MIFSEKLQIIRKNRGITQEELAETLQVSRQAVTKWESGQSYPDIMNLIEISKLFHVTVDYLVKDEECSKTVKPSLETNQEKLIDFLLEASRNTYAGFGEPCEPSRLNSHDFCYESGDYLYHDTYVGGECFTGEEVVWHKQTPIFAMNYSGRVLADTFSGDFLKAALREGTREYPYRGPAVYQEGEYTYQSKVIGDIDWYQGYEEIYFHDQKIYECFYHGGIVK